MDIEGYEFVQNISLDPFSELILDIVQTHVLIVGDDAMWALISDWEGNTDERTDRKKGADSHTDGR